MARCKVLPELTTPPLQVALIEALRQRDDTAAAGALAEIAQKGKLTVRVASIAALGDLGDSTVVPLLAKGLASDDDAEQKAVRQALLDLRRGAVAEALVDCMAGSDPKVQKVLGRIIADRGEREAVAGLMKLAGQKKPSAREASLQALGRLADATDVPAIVELLKRDRDPEGRASIAETLTALCIRLQTESGGLDVDPVVAALSGGRQGGAHGAASGGGGPG